jgi:hypothetical protein
VSQSWIIPLGTIFVADPHRDGNQRFVVRGDEKSAAFLELEAAIRLLVS